MRGVHDTRQTLGGQNKNRTHTVHRTTCRNLAYYFEKQMSTHPGKLPQSSQLQDQCSSVLSVSRSRARRPGFHAADARGTLSTFGVRFCVNRTKCEPAASKKVQNGGNHLAGVRALGPWIRPCSVGSCLPGVSPCRWRTARAESRRARAERRRRWRRRRSSRTAARCQRLWRDGASIMLY